MTPRAYALAAAIALGGCSLVNDPGAHQGGMDGGADAGPVAVPASEFCGELAELMCFSFFNCCGPAPEPSEGELAECISDASADCAANGLSRLLVDGRTGYDPVVAAEVLAEGRALASECSNDILSWYTERSGFQRALTGTVPGGGSCTPMERPVGDFDYAALFSCEGGASACVFVADNQWSCLDRQSQGGSCILYWDCEDGLRCESLFVGARGTCRARHPDGTPCGSAVDCQSLFCDTTCRTPTSDEIYCSPGLPAAMP